MSRHTTHPRRRGASWRRTSAAAAAVLALGSLAACGSDEKPAASDDPSSSESTGSADASEPAEPTESASDDASPDGGDVAAGEAMDKADFVDLFSAAFEKASTTRLTMTFGGAMEISAEGVADFSTSPPRMQFSMTNPGNGQDLGMVLSGGAMYVQVAPQQYARYDLSDPTGPLAGMTDQLDPSALVDTFDKAITSATYVGEEDVDGEPMERYRVEIDTAATLEGSDVPQGGAGLPEVSSFDLWFDADGMFRRMQGDLGPTAGTFEATYDDWGDPVEITVPPKAQVVDLARPEKEPKG